MNMALFPDVVVNGETIPSAAIAAEAQNHDGPQGQARHRLAQGGAGPGDPHAPAAGGAGARADGDPEELAPGRVETEDEALIRALLDEALTIAPVTDADVRAEWAKDPDRFRSAPLWDVSHILCACDPRDDAERAHGRGPRQGHPRRGWTATPRALPWPRAKAIAGQRRRAGIWASLAPATPCRSSRPPCAPCRRRHDAGAGPVAPRLAHHPAERHRPGSGAALSRSCARRSRRRWKRPPGRAPHGSSSRLWPGARRSRAQAWRRSERKEAGMKAQQSSQMPQLRRGDGLSPTDPALLASPLDFLPRITARTSGLHCNRPAGLVRAL